MCINIGKFLLSVHRHVLGWPNWLHCRGEMISNRKSYFPSSISPSPWRPCSLSSSPAAVLFIVLAMNITAPSIQGVWWGYGQHLILVVITIIAATLFILFKLIIITITKTTNFGIQGVPDGVMDTYCWLHSTFTLPHLGVVEIDNVNGVDQVFSWSFQMTRVYWKGKGIIMIIIDNYRQEPHPGVGPVYDDLSRITEHKWYLKLNPKKMQRV